MVQDRSVLQLQLQKTLRPTTKTVALRAFLATVALPILLDVRLGDVAVASFVSTDFHRSLLGRLMSATRD